MSGHSGFAPIGNNNPAVQMPPVGGVGNNDGQPANAPQVQLQAQPENVQAKLQPLADRLESFAARPNASLSSAEFTKYAVELKDACDVVSHAAANGFPSSDGKSRVMPDSDFLAAVAKLADTAKSAILNARKKIGEAYLKNFIDHSLGIRKDLTAFAPENMWAVKNQSPMLAMAVEQRRELGKAAREYLADPDSKAGS